MTRSVLDHWVNFAKYKLIYSNFQEGKEPVGLIYCQIRAITATQCVLRNSVIAGINNELRFTDSPQ